MDVLRQLLEDARAVLKEMTATQRVSLAMMVVTVSSLLGFVVWIGSAKEKQGYENLPVKVQAANVKEMRERLEAEGLGPVKYDIDSETMSVPTEKIDRAVLFLAGENLLPADSGGFKEWIERRQFSTPRSQAEDMMTVAYQNEVARLVEKIDLVREAKVIFSPYKRKSLFQPHLKQKAAVHITTALGKRLDDKAAETIIALVAASRPGLERTDVQVTDQFGKHFRARDPESLDQITTTRFAMERQMNEILRDKVEELCRQAIPGAEAFAFVDHKLNMDRKIKRERKYSEGPKLHEQTRKYSEESSEKPSSEVGTQGNVRRQVNLGAAGPEKRVSIGDKFADRDYQNNVEDVETRFAPDLESLTVSVVVHLPFDYVKDQDGNWVYETDADGNPLTDAKGEQIRQRVSVPKLTGQELQNLERSLMKAAGMTTGQADRELEILQVAWKPPREPEAPPPTRTEQFREWVMTNLVPLGLVFILLFTVWLIYAQAKRSLPSEEVADLLAEDSTQVSMLPESSDLDRANASFEALRNKVSDLVAEDPRKAASLIRKWMSKESY